MHAQEPGNFCNRLLFLIDELARVRDLLNWTARDDWSGCIVS
jgi:hypothetical protein